MQALDNRKIEVLKGSIGMTGDFIKITNLKVFAHHGVFPEETRDGQDFYVNAKLFLDCRKAGKTDNLSDSLNYGEVSHFITDFLQDHTYKLIESVAEQLAEAMLLSMPVLKGVEIELCKPHAPIGLPFENVSVTMKRQWHEVYLAVGSNLGDKNAYIGNGIDELRRIKEIKEVRVSELLVTKPYGGVEQDDFVNGAIALKTLLSPQELLEKLHEIEQHANRERIIHWGPRTLDLDIIFYDKLHKPEIHLSMLKSILQIGVPNGLENSIFQIGKILVASIVSGFGTISITANAVAGNLASLQVIPGMALGMAMITVVGQCIGAKDYEAVKKYTKKLMLITYGVVWAMTLLMLLFSKQILSFYSLSEETTTMTMEVFIVHGICAVIVWPLAFALPNALRAANDVRFTMIVSLLSMWIFRIGFSYILAIYFNMGILGTWIAMCIDWFCRGACFVIRFARGKWKNISFIDN